mmetsp:Transcript_593/g.1284  ORF Transcript_593/g.1284 Transcript_593/m.1284 type:complete len:211 (-) Transcript_593:1674-2306(-)
MTTLIASTVTFSSLFFPFNVELAKSTMSMIMQFTTDAKISADCSSARSASSLQFVNKDLAASRSNSPRGMSPQEDTAGNRPGAPKVRIWESSRANSGACAFAPTSALRSVSRMLALRFAKIPSFRFGFGAGTAGGGDGGAAGFDGDFGMSSPEVGLGFGGFGFFWMNCSYSSSSSSSNSSSSSSSSSSSPPKMSFSCRSLSLCAAPLFSL